MKKINSKGSSAISTDSFMKTTERFMKVSPNFYRGAKLSVFFLFYSRWMLLGTLCVNLYSEESVDHSHYHWIEEEMIALQEDGVYISTVRGMLKLNVVGYDETTRCYQVECRCAVLDEKYNQDSD